jgi:aerobic carbon-monoxide dehydrogenase small subunit
VTHVSVSVNGEPREADVEGRTLLVYFLREHLGLTGTNVGCDTSTCGSCTVLLDGESVKSCTMLTAQADGHEVTTIEGLADGDALHPLQESFHRNHGLQCGYCTPGMILATRALVRECPGADDREIARFLRGNICRCTGYVKIREAVRRALDAARGSIPCA